MTSSQTIEGVAKAEVVEKKSRFIAHLAHVETEEEALAFLAEIRSQHAQARHNVYAYSLRTGRTRYSDDGEPAQTSGLPTYETLAHADLVDVICVTTRYFGGTLLGTGGLVRAYTAACQAAIKVARIVTVSECVDVTITVPYDLYQSVARLADAPGVHVMQTDFTDQVSLRFRTRADNADAFTALLVETTRGSCAPLTSEPFEGIL